MNFKRIILFLLILVIFTNIASATDTWIPDTSVILGLTDVGKTSDPAIFLDGSILKLISGNNTGGFYGWYWNGSAWIPDSSVVSGLTDAGDHSSPTVFLDGSTLKLITGNYGGTFIGYHWSGSAWIPDSSVVSGLSGIGVASRPTVFLDGSALKLMAGESFATMNGYHWSGSAWIPDSSVVSGISALQYSSPTVFLDGGTLKLIIGNYWGSFSGYYWSGSTWVSNTTIISGLSGVGYYSAPEVFLDGSTLKIIVGEDDGPFNGWSEPCLYTLSGTISNGAGAVNNAAIVLNNSGGSIISNETGQYEITGITSGTYLISVTEASHHDYSDTVTVTSNTEKNILLTLISSEVVPIVAPPPLVLIPTPSSIVEETKLTIFEESIEKLNDLSILITDLMGKGLTWMFILVSYIGAFVSHLLLKGKEDEESNVFNILLFGTVGWALLLLINTTGYITIVSMNFATNALIFGIGGFAVYTILDMLSSKE